VYREWGVVREDLSPAVLVGTAYKHSVAAGALSRTKTEKAWLTLEVKVVKAYYGLAVAERKYVTAEQGLDQANRLVAGQSLEEDGRKPHSDVVKFQLQQTSEEKTLRDAKLAGENERLDLAVLLFRDFDENFEIVDGSQVAPPLPSFSEMVQMAKAKNPDLRIAVDTARVANLGVSMARQAFLPTLKVEVDYGIESNCVGFHCVDASYRALGGVPPLGYFLTAVLNVPVWDWGCGKASCGKRRSIMIRPIWTCSLRSGIWRETFVRLTTRHRLRSRTSIPFAARPISPLRTCR
jgi:outer membrane protein TolC